MRMIQSPLFFFMDSSTLVTVFLFLLTLCASPETARIFKILHMSERWTELLQLQAWCSPDKLSQGVQRQHREVSRASPCWALKVALSQEKEVETIASYLFLQLCWSPVSVFTHWCMQQANFMYIHCREQVHSHFPSWSAHPLFLFPCLQGFA